MTSREELLAIIDRHLNGHAGPQYRAACENIRREIERLPDPAQAAPWQPIDNAAFQNTDGAGSIAVLAAVRHCANLWDGNARLLGNVRASDIARACNEAIPALLPKGPIHRTPEDGPSPDYPTRDIGVCAHWQDALDDWAKKNLPPESAGCITSWSDRIAEFIVSTVSSTQPREDDCSCGGGDISGHDNLCPYAVTSTDICCPGGCMFTPCKVPSTDKAPSPERCPTCNMTDAGYSVYVEGWCRDPWHGDDHLRAKG